jgi:hypothetical protein
MNPAIDVRLQELRQVRWFSSIGVPFTTASKTQLITSWESAFTWAARDISWWCNVEGKKQLYENLAKDHYSRFVEWNIIAKSIFPQVTTLVETVILPSLPQIAFPPKAKAWIQSQLLSSLMELAYRDCVEVTLFSEQIELYTTGHFPCGWYVEAPEAFPHDAQIVVF